MPPKQTAEVKGKFLRQQRLEAFTKPSKDSDDDNVFNFKSNVKSTETTSTTPPNIKSEPLTNQAKMSSPTKKCATNEKIQSQSGTCTSSVIALSGANIEIIEIEESQPLFDDCSETFCEKVELKVQPVESVAHRTENCNNQKIVDNHLVSCRQCKVFMQSNNHLTTEEKVGMVDRCNFATRQDTDSEFWNPRFLPTPASQKQETLIDDRFVTRDTITSNNI